jgi:hypothetical protein
MAPGITDSAAESVVWRGTGLFLKQSLRPELRDERKDFEFDGRAGIAEMLVHPGDESVLIASRTEPGYDCRGSGIQCKDFLGACFEQNTAELL